MESAHYNSINVKVTSWNFLFYSTYKPEFQFENNKQLHKQFIDFRIVAAFIQPQQILTLEKLEPKNIWLFG